VFQELMPLLAQRTLLLIVSRIGADQIRINVIPQRVKSVDADQNDALITPLSISGTPNELDEGLSVQLAGFVEAHLGLSSTLKSVKEQMEAAAKTARETTRKSSAGKAVTIPAKPTSSAEAVEPAVSAPIAHDTAPTAEQSGSLFGDAPAGER
jgi:PRTRC genetic system protein E